MPRLEIANSDTTDDPGISLSDARAFLDREVKDQLDIEGT